MAGRRRRRKSGVPSVLGGKLFGGPRRTARAFVTVVLMVFALIAVLVLQTWQRVEVVETMRDNGRLSRELSRLGDQVVRQETELERKTSRPHLIARAERELDLRPAGWADVVFVTDTTDVSGAYESSWRRSRGGGEM